MIAKVAVLATALVLAILLSSAYLRLTAVQAHCPTGTACEAAERTEATPAPLGRRLARLAHRLSASTVAVLAVLIAFVAWTSRERGRRNRWLSAALVALTLFLAVLGAAAGSTYTSAVTLGNVLGSNALAGVFWWMWLQGRGRAPSPVASHGARAAWPVALLTLAIALICGVALGAGETLPLPLSLAYNLFATLVLLTSLWWLSRVTSAMR